MIVDFFSFCQSPLMFHYWLQHLGGKWKLIHFSVRKRKFRWNGLSTLLILQWWLADAGSKQKLKELMHKWAKSQTTKAAIKSWPNIAVKDKYLGSVSQSTNVCISILVRKSPGALWEFFFLICHHLPGCWHCPCSHQAGGSSSPGTGTSYSLRQIATSLIQRQTEQSAAGEEQKTGNQTRDKLVCLPQNSDRKAPSVLVNSSKCSSLLSDLHNLHFAHTKFWCLSSFSWDPQPKNKFDICEAWSLGSHKHKHW